MVPVGKHISKSLTPEEADWPPLKLWWEARQYIEQHNEGKPVTSLSRLFGRKAFGPDPFPSVILAKEVSDVKVSMLDVSHPHYETASSVFKETSHSHWLQLLFTQPNLQSEDDPVRRKPDITVAKNKLKWKPKVELEDGLKEAVRYFKKIL